MNYLNLNRENLEAEIKQVLNSYELFEKERVDKVLPSYFKENFDSFLRGQIFENEDSDLTQKILKEMNSGVLSLNSAGYMGVFNPKPTSMGVISGLINALYNAQLASTTSSPFPIMAENYLIQYFGELAGYLKSDKEKGAKIEGHFTNGGTEGNITAVLCALNDKFPSIKEKGILSVKGRPCIYGSVETHHSVQRASFVSGLGSDSLREIPVNEKGEIIISNLIEKIREDKENGDIPFMIVGTLGTTATGAIDDLKSLGKVANDFNLWLHVDAAYGGGALLLKEKDRFIQGLEVSHSFSVDAHKWMSLPFGSSLFITRKKGICRSTFETLDNTYMPEATESADSFEPYRDSLQWSRKFTGLGLFLTLGHFGRNSFDQKMSHQLAIAKIMRTELVRSGYIIENDSILPIICFSHSKLEAKKIGAFKDYFIEQCPQFFLSSVYSEGKRRNVLRLSINNNSLTETKISEFITGLDLMLNNFLAL